MDENGVIFFKNDDFFNRKLKINKILTDYNINIVGQYLKTNESIGYVITDINNEYNKQVIQSLRKIHDTIRLRILY